MYLTRYSVPHTVDKAAGQVYPQDMNITEAVMEGIITEAEDNWSPSEEDMAWFMENMHVDPMEMEDR